MSSRSRHLTPSGATAGEEGRDRVPRLRVLTPPMGELELDLDDVAPVELVRRTLALCKRQWCPHLLFALAERPHRFNEIGRAVTGLSGKVLTATLRALEADGVIVRDPGGAYRLTPFGYSLLEVLDFLADWAAHHRDELGENRATAARPPVPA